MDVVWRTDVGDRTNCLGNVNIAAKELRLVPFETVSCHSIKLNAAFGLGTLEGLMKEHRVHTTEIDSLPIHIWVLGVGKHQELSLLAKSPQRNHFRFCEV